MNIDITGALYTQTGISMQRWRHGNVFDGYFNFEGDFLTENFEFISVNDLKSCN